MTKPTQKWTLAELQTYTTLAGQVLHLRPVSLFLVERIRLTVEQEFRAAGELLDPPTYTTTTVAGDTQTHRHDAKSLRTPAEHADWDAYQSARRRLANEQNQRVGRYVMAEGVQDDPVRLERWVKRVKKFGLEVPTDPDELKLFWLEQDALPTEHDQSEAAWRVMALSHAGLPEEVLTAAINSFRGGVSTPADTPAGAEAPTQ